MFVILRLPLLGGAKDFLTCISRRKVKKKVDFLPQDQFPLHKVNKYIIGPQQGRVADAEHPTPHYMFCITLPRSNPCKPTIPPAEEPGHGCPPWDKIRFRQNIHWKGLTDMLRNANDILSTRDTILAVSHGSWGIKTVTPNFTFLGVKLGVKLCK